MPSSNPNHLDPSELGTREYWDTLYARELRNHAADPSDEGTTWFDDANAECKMAQLLGDMASARQLARETASLLDLGCGNGSMLFALRAEQWKGRALGVDYSPQSVALARQVASSRGVHDARTVDFAEWDVMGGSYEGVLSGAQEHGWDVVLDKGTFDAISLAGPRSCELYPARVAPLVRKGGLFLVTSCNWTEEELTSWFVGEDNGAGFVVAGRAEYRTFSFGGVKGQTVSTLCFERI
ncbi:hypothetical protein NOR_03609 [Metarhizium rileyi]|uniref:Protein-lysine N-methyltransferase EFM4 n=1 Tax=Metarhizium rileyi (strain RCEF 4871) TaxID=1649241 RepID=A0A167F6A4_METRR|nr:hypothetical protein NOR_03609 [Metarhizium rileyi RCEF 4871]